MIVECEIKLDLHSQKSDNLVTVSDIIGVYPTTN
jgi:hypothetical protein